jgi:hypothetical protein
MILLTRLIMRLLRRRWGLILIGAIMVIGGLIWGLTSHQVGYQSSQQNVTYRIAIGSQSGNTYIHADRSSDYFAAFSGDFNPPITQSAIDNSNTISFVARTDTSSLNPALNAPDGSTVNDAHKIEKLVFYDKSGNVQGTFTTTEYDANPNGFNDNEWLKAIWLIIAGVLVAVAAFLYPMLVKQPQVNTGFSINAPGAQPYQQPYQQPNPYGQVYQGPAQYPQGTPPYPPQTPAYGQPPQAAPYPPQAPAYGQPPQAAPYPPQAPVYGQPPYQQPPQE